MTVFLVRHADAKSRANWDADDMLRPLSKKGEAQATGLVAQLDGAKVARILSSPAVRCTTTVAPLASWCGRKVEQTDVLVEGADAAKAYDLLCLVAREPGDAVLCTHGDLVPELLRIAARDGVTLEDEARWAKGSTWALETDGRGFTRARYLPPPGEQ
jgi:8-oxo-dGTP diphosphatase